MSIKPAAVAFCCLAMAAVASAAPVEPPELQDPREIVRRTLARYESLETYASEGAVSVDMDFQGKRDLMEVRFSLRLGRPSSYRIVWQTTFKGSTQRESAIWSSAEGTRVRLGGSAYKLGDDPAAFSFASGVSALASHTIPSLFYASKERSLEQLTDLQLVGAEEVGGEECYKISGATPRGDPVLVWISRKRLLLLKRQLLLGKGQRLPAVDDRQMDQSLERLGAPPTEESRQQLERIMQQAESLLASYDFSQTLTEIHSEIRIDGDLEARDFAYVLPEEVTLRESPWEDVAKGARMLEGLTGIFSIPGRVPEEASPPMPQNVLAGPVRLFKEEVERPFAMETMARLLARAGSVAGVEQSAVIDILPGPGDPRQRMLVLRRNNASPSGTAAAVLRVVSPGYFATVGLDLLFGRPLAEGDDDNAPGVAVVNLTMARQTWPGQGPIGETLVLPDDRGSKRVVVGVVEDGPEAQGVPEVYIPYTQAPTLNAVFLLVRTAEQPAVAVRLRELLGSEKLGHGELRSLEEMLKTLPPPR
jgi:hypothetical protein